MRKLDCSCSAPWQKLTRNPRGFLLHNLSAHCPHTHPPSFHPPSLPPSSLFPRAYAHIQRQDMRHTQQHSTRKRKAGSHLMELNHLYLWQSIIHGGKVQSCHCWDMLICFSCPSVGIAWICIRCGSILRWVTGFDSVSSGSSAVIKGLPYQCWGDSSKVGVENRSSILTEKYHIISLFLGKTFRIIIN